MKYTYTQWPQQLTIFTCTNKITNIIIILIVLQKLMKNKLECKKKLNVEYKLIDKIFCLISTFLFLQQIQLVLRIQRAKNVAMLKNWLNVL